MKKHLVREDRVAAVLVEIPNHAALGLVAGLLGLETTHDIIDEATCEDEPLRPCVDVDALWQGSLVRRRACILEAVDAVDIWTLDEPVPQASRLQKLVHLIEYLQVVYIAPGLYLPPNAAIRLDRESIRTQTNREVPLLRHASQLSQGVELGLNEGEAAPSDVPSGDEPQIRLGPEDTNGGLDSLWLLGVHMDHDSMPRVADLLQEALQLRYRGMGWGSKDQIGHHSATLGTSSPTTNLGWRIFVERGWNNTGVVIVDVLGARAASIRLQGLGSLHGEFDMCGYVSTMEIDDSLTALLAALRYPHQNRFDRREITTTLHRFRVEPQMRRFDSVVPPWSVAMPLLYWVYLGKYAN